MSTQRNNANGPVGPESLAWLLQHHGAALELYARQLCQTPEDAVQEALIALAAQATAPRDVLAWTYRVVRNKAIGFARAASRRRKRETQTAGDQSPWFECSAADRIDGQTATAALERLAGEDRELIVARLWGGLTFQQIAQVLGMSDSTTQRRYESALMQLREILRLPCPTNR